MVCELRYQQFLIQNLFNTAESSSLRDPHGLSTGRLSLFPAVDTGTIPFESKARNMAEREALAERYYPGALCDKAQGSGDGCRLWHLNVFALTWSFDP